MVKLANYKINIEIEKLKINVEGAREIAPEIAANVATQIASIIQPALLTEGKDSNYHPPAIDVTPAASGRRRGRRAAGSPKPDGPKETVTWTHDPNKWGTPVQDWKQWQKILWLLSVVEQGTGNADGLTNDQITDTFNTKFKASGVIKKGNINRDLGSQDNFFGSVDGRWFLKQGGKTEAAKLIAQAKGETA